MFSFLYFGQKSDLKSHLWVQGITHFALVWDHTVIFPPGVCVPVFLFPGHGEQPLSIACHLRPLGPAAALLCGLPQVDWGWLSALTSSHSCRCQMSSFFRNAVACAVTYSHEIWSDRWTEVQPVVGGFHSPGGWDRSFKVDSHNYSQLVQQNQDPKPNRNNVPCISSASPTPQSLSGVWWHFIHSCLSPASQSLGEKEPCK